MLVSSKKATAEKDAAFKEGKKSFIDSLQAWHKKLAEEQIRLEASYSLGSIDKFSVNVWDDYPKEEGTYAYVEMSEVPDKICFDVLIHLLGYAKANQVIKSTGVKLGLRFYDSSAVYPALIGNKEGEYSLFKRWELTICGADYETLEIIVNQLKMVPLFEDKKVDVYSES